VPARSHGEGRRFAVATRDVQRSRQMVGAAGFEPATLCLAADPAFLQGLDYIFGIAAALLIVSEDSPKELFANSIGVAC